MKSTELKPPSDVVVTALRRVLKPLIRFMLSQGITYRYMIRLQKELFVEVVSSTLSAQHENRSDSKISLLTGVSRVEVNRLRKQPVVTDVAPANVSLGVRLVSHWISDRDYLDDQDRPLPLTRSDRRDVTPSFETLVASAGIDIPPSAVLDEWLRLGVVGIDTPSGLATSIHRTPSASSLRWGGYASERPMTELSLAGQTCHKTHSPMLEITP